MRNLAIIPARSGSKGLKDKNIRRLCGRPLMAYTIEAALKSGEFAEVMVSTDAENYATTAREYGAMVPFLRSTETSSDEASTWDMASEVLQNYRKLGQEFDSFCVLQPTSPLRTAGDIKNAYSLYYERALCAVVSVCRAEHSPLWCGQLPEDLSLDGFIKEIHMRQRQSMAAYYRVNGAIYIVNVNAFCEDRYLYRRGSYAYVMDAERSIDIDTDIDFELAEVLMRRRNECI